MPQSLDGAEQPVYNGVLPKVQHDMLHMVFGLQWQRPVNTSLNQGLRYHNIIHVFFLCSA